MEIREYREAVTRLIAANHAYYGEGNSNMSDREYDILMDKVRDFETTNGVVYSNSPTQVVGSTAKKEGVRVVKHRIPMLSLDKTKELQDLVAFVQQHGKCGLGLKEDGVSLSVHYVKGVLTQGVLRGNGEEGEDVTDILCCIQGIPQRIKEKEDLEVRGEVVMSYANFDKINATLEVAMKYKNPRNLCAGTLKLQDKLEIQNRGLQFIAFGVAQGYSTLDSKLERLETLGREGFEVVEVEPVTASNVETVELKFRASLQKGEIATPVDGLVLFVDSVSKSAELGRTSRVPKDALAFKWGDTAIETVFRGVEWNVSRQGYVVPTALFDSVEVEGSNIARATLNNLSYIEELKLGVGDTITVFKANMIIPQIGENLTQSNNLELPTTCPVCGETLEVEQNDEAKKLFCPNTLCGGRGAKKLVHYVSKQCMDIQGLGGKTIEKLYDAGVVVNLVDIYTLSKKKEEVISAGIMGELLFDKLVAEIREKSKKVRTDKFITALGITLVGKTVTKEIFKNYTLAEILTGQIEIAPQGVGEKAFSNLMGYIEKNKTEIQSLLDYVTVVDIKVDETTTPVTVTGSLQGKRILVTGTCSVSRSDMQRLIEENGGIIATAVNKKTDVVVYGEAPGGKVDKAKELGISLWTEEDLRREIGEEC